MPIPVTVATGTGISRRRGTGPLIIASDAAGERAA
jgi:hypothetical protein